MQHDPDYDVALSFAGENRPYVDAVAHELQQRGVKLFYDLFEEANLWGKDLYVYLSDLYQNRAKFTVMFISDAYARKLWTTHERQSAQARAFREAGEYILPARFDDTAIPAVLPTTGYIDLRGRTPDAFASLVVKKLISAGGSVPTELVRRDFSTAIIHPAADPKQCLVTIRNDQGEPIPGCTVTAQADNATVIQGTSGEDGQCLLTIKTRRLIRLLISHPEHPAGMLDKVDLAEAVEATLPMAENIGSLTITRTGYIPILNGRLAPILDNENRRYLYANNIAIDGGKVQPVNFSVNVPIELEDAEGTIVFATVKHIFGDTSLIQYTRR